MVKGLYTGKFGIRTNRPYGWRAMAILIEDYVPQAGSITICFNRNLRIDAKLDYSKHPNDQNENKIQRKDFEALITKAREIGYTFGTRLHYLDSYFPGDVTWSISLTFYPPDWRILRKFVNERTNEHGNYKRELEDMSGIPARG